MILDMGGILPLPFFYEAALGGRTLAVVPDVQLPALVQPTAISASAENWSAWYPENFPLIGEGEFTGAIQTGFLYPPLISSQNGSGTNPKIEWKVAKNLSQNFATVNSLELLYSTQLGWMSKWTIHTPAGQQSLVLPTPPAAINDPVLPQASYSLRLNVRAVVGKRYHDVVADDDLHDLDKTLATEVLKVGGEFSDIKLNR